jgi:IS30 family transposase
MYVNIDKLNGKIAECRKTKRAIAGKIGVHNSTLYRRLKKNSLMIGDMHIICDYLHLTPEEAMEIFLAQ